MERKVFELPFNPMTKKSSRIVIELPSPDSVWYLVLEPEKAVPLIGLSTKKGSAITAKDVLDCAAKQQGENWVAQFVMNGYSNIEVKS